MTGLEWHGKSMGSCERCKAWSYDLWDGVCRTCGPNHVGKWGIREKWPKNTDSSWELEMMDAFTDNRHGFTLILTNPPWDKIRPNKNEFFGQFSPEYRRSTMGMGKVEKDNLALRKKEIEEKHHTEFYEYSRTLEDKRTFYKNRGGMGENTDFEAYRLVLERILEIMSPGGILSIVVPSAILNSRGATAIRKHILEFHILSLYEFENEGAIFENVDRRTKFVLLTARKDNPREFPAAFYLHDTSSLDDMESKSFKMSKDDVKSLSPDLMIIHDFKTSRDRDIFQKIFSSHHMLKNIDKWQVDLGRELNIGEEKDRKLLIGEGGPNTWPVLESKNFHQHIWNFTKPTNHAHTIKALERTSKIKKFRDLNAEIHENPRLVYRSISSATNTRTMIASIIPKSFFTTVNTYMAIPYVGRLKINHNYQKLNAYLCGIFNSYTFDYMIRPKIDKAVQTYHIEATPVPDDFTGNVASQIGNLTASLFLSDCWNDDYANIFSIPKNTVSKITLDKRIELVSKIDALVAIHYGIAQIDYEHILENFNLGKSEFTDAELDLKPSFPISSKGDRDRFMKKFFHHVQISALKHFEHITCSMEGNL